MFKKVITAPKLLKFISNNFASAMALFPFILIKNEGLKTNQILINHELIHLRQQLEMLVLPFYIWYISEYFIRRLQYKSHYEAYKNISFEREAYANQQNLKYLKKRKFWSFIKYVM